MASTTRYRVFGKKPGIAYGYRYAKTLERAQQQVANIFREFSEGSGLIPNSVLIEVSDKPKGARTLGWGPVKEYHSLQELLDQIRDA